MGNNKKSVDKSRRWFFSLLLSQKEKSSTEKIKMLTADGKLVEVDKTLFDAVTKKQKATNKEIYYWMKNPSKENS